MTHKKGPTPKDNINKEDLDLVESDTPSPPCNTFTSGDLHQYSPQRNPVSQLISHILPSLSGDYEEEGSSNSESSESYESDEESGQDDENTEEAPINNSFIRGNHSPSDNPTESGTLLIPNYSLQQDEQKESTLHSTIDSPTREGVDEVNYGYLKQMGEEARQGGCDMTENRVISKISIPELLPLNQNLQEETNGSYDESCTITHHSNQDEDTVSIPQSTLSADDNELKFVDSESDQDTHSQNETAEYSPSNRIVDSCPESPEISDKQESIGELRKIIMLDAIESRDRKKDIEELWIEPMSDTVSVDDRSIHPEKLFMFISYLSISDWIEMGSTPIGFYMLSSAINLVKMSPSWASLVREDLVYNRLTTINITFHEKDQTILANYESNASRCKVLDIAFGIDKTKGESKERIKSLAYYLMLLFVSISLEPKSTDTPVIVLENGQSSWIREFLFFLSEVVIVSECEKKPSVIIANSTKKIDIVDIITSIVYKYMNNGSYLLSALTFKKCHIDIGKSEMLNSIYSEAGRFAVMELVFDNCTITNRACLCIGEMGSGAVTIVEISNSSIVHDNGSGVNIHSFHGWMHKMNLGWALSNADNIEPNTIYGSCWEKMQYNIKNSIVNDASYVPRMFNRLTSLNLTASIGSEIFNRYPVFFKKGPHESFDYIENIKFKPPKNDIARHDKISCSFGESKIQSVTTRLLSSFSGCCETDENGSKLRSMPLVGKDVKKITKTAQYEKKEEKKKKDSSIETYRESYAYNIDHKDYTDRLIIFRMPLMIRTISLSNCNFFFVDAILQYLLNYDNNVHSFVLDNCSLVGCINSGKTSHSIDAIETLTKVYEKGCSIRELRMTNCDLDQNEESSLSELVTVMGITEKSGCDSWYVSNTDHSLPECIIDLSSNPLTPSSLRSIFAKNKNGKKNGDNPFKTRAKRSLLLYCTCRMPNELLVEMNKKFNKVSTEMTAFKK